MDGGKDDPRRQTMDIGVGLRVAMILTGIFLFIITLFSLAKRKMTDSFVLVWGLISIIFVLLGIFLHPAELAHYISGTGMLLAGAIGFCLVFGAYFISIRVSELTRRNLELAIQITLLKQEITLLKQEIAALEAGKAEWISKEDGLRNEKDTDRYQHAGAWRG